jgi:hypothetical protein
MHLYGNLPARGHVLHPSTGLEPLPLLKELATNIAMRIDRGNGRAYGGCYPHAARSIDRAGRKNVTRVDPANKRLGQSSWEN